MAQDTQIQGLACDHAALEVSVDGSPIPEAFSSVDTQVSREFEKIWLNGKATANERTEGKIDPSCDVEMPVKQYHFLVKRLGGGAPSPSGIPAFMTKEFSFVLTFRPKNQPFTFQTVFRRCNIKEVSGPSSSPGKAGMMKLKIDAIEFEPKDPV